MKIAIVHDSLVEFGGAERVLLALLELFPNADVYTAYADKAFVKTFFPSLGPSQLFPSWADGTIVAKHGSLFQLFAPMVWRSFNLGGYDLVISVSGYFCSNLVHAPQERHIQYILCPPKNLFGLEAPFPRQHFLGNNIILRGIYASRIRSGYHVIAISRNIHDVLQSLFGIESGVIYPPVQVPQVMPKRKTPKYFIIVSRLDNLKSIEIAIEACNRLKLPLKIVGDSPYVQHKHHLRTIAGPTIEFLGFLLDKEINHLYEEAIAFIFTAENEDFGIAPVESMAHGVPVIAYYGGGARDTIISEKTGVFFYEHSVHALMNVLRSFRKDDFSSVSLYQYAQQFNKEKFKMRINLYVQQAIIIANHRAHTRRLK